jgi:hypothetical protein
MATETSGGTRAAISILETSPSRDRNLRAVALLAQSPAIAGGCVPRVGVHPQVVSAHPHPGWRGGAGCDARSQPIRDAMTPSAAVAAVSVRSTKRPSEVAKNPAALAWWSSASLSPPSGPMSRAMGMVGCHSASAS